MEKRRISARQVIADLKAGMSAVDLMEKYGITEKALRYVLKRLVESGLMTELQYYERTDLSESAVARALSHEPVHVLNCPRCGRALPEDGGECDFCRRVTLG